MALPATGGHISFRSTLSYAAQVRHQQGKLDMVDQRFPTGLSAAYHRHDLENDDCDDGTAEDLAQRKFCMEPDGTLRNMGELSGAALAGIWSAAGPYLLNGLNVLLHCELPEDR